MTFPVAHKLLTVGGQLYNRGEDWTFSMRIVAANADSSVSQAQVDAVSVPILAWWNDLANPIPSLHNLDYCKLATIQPDGKYPPTAPSFEHVFPANTVGKSGSQVTWPSQCSLAVTLLTALPRGRAHIGRFYLPPMNILLSGFGLVPSATQTSLGTQIKTMVDGINAIASVGRVRVMSRLGSGAMQDVTGIGVGQVVDTQRRRRSSLPENRVVVPLA